MTGPAGPTLIVISGPPGTGKTTIAHALARDLGCPAICRDEIREGVVRAGTPDPGMRHTLATFFEVVTVLLRGGDDGCRGRVPGPAVAPRPRAPHRSGPGPGGALHGVPRDGPAAPTLTVDTSDGYSPTLADIVAFAS